MNTTYRHLLAAGVTPGEIDTLRHQKPPGAATRRLLETYPARWRDGDARLKRMLVYNLHAAMDLGMSAQAATHFAALDAVLCNRAPDAC
jgi:hypothetical protein